MPGPWSRTVSSNAPGTQESSVSTGPAGRGELRGVVEQVGQQPGEAGRDSGDRGAGRRRVGAEGEGDLRPVLAGRADRVLQEGGRAYLFHQGLGFLVAGQFDQVVDEGGDLAQLTAQGGRGAVALRVGQPVGAGEEFGVGAERGQRGAQFVGGVRDQPALRGDGLFQFAEHDVEAGGEPGDLVLAGRRAGGQFDAVAGVAGGGDPFGGGGEPGDRGQAGAGDPVAECGGQQHARAADRGQCPGGLPYAPVDGVRAQRDLQRLVPAREVAW